MFENQKKTEYQKIKAHSDDKGEKAFVSYERKW